MMRTRCVGAAALLFVSSVWAALTPSDVENALKNASIIPEYISDFTPQGLLDIIYIDPATNKSISINPGKAISVNQTVVRPQYAVTSQNTPLGGQNYVLIMFDPDVPTPANRSLAQVRHMIAQVQLGNDTTALASATGLVLTNNTPAVSEYINPQPPPGDAHRYTVVLYHEPASFASQVGRFVNASSSIFKFDARAFAEALGLGDPVVSNFFLSGPNTPDATPDESNSTATGAGASPTNSVTGAAGRGGVGSSVAATVVAVVVSLGMVAW
ncbi:phosphatidylethanolamine-binding protein [Epithele typhae]|uniref:phosphatidylethanolamine-binding protein n=1 Tax=Epithele typhae TaxID=378194 RepID=UPI00200748D3|nr:phosphatidylethanolamine-binding protein [Epithele typhae]KAH9945088.1 phosphatidylethanolamine-binding protein [Epithele typhae]